MLTEYLASHPLLPAPPAFPRWCPPAGSEAWQTIAPGLRAEILREAAAYARQPYPLRRASDFLAFVRTGSRQADEAPYFFRRRKLAWAALRRCVEESAPLDDVIDGLWCICEETGWVVSAHNVNPIPGAPPPEAYPLPDAEKPYIDLFAAQTGMILSLVCQLLGAELDRETPMLRQRVKTEIERRILRPFMETDDFWWMGVRRRDLNNWTPWILSNVLLCAWLFPLSSPEMSALLARACGMLDRWLSCVPEDGGCDEGAGYWNMAGGALLDCLEILEALTGDQAALWRNEKIRRILSFPRKAEIGGGWFVNFADCDARPFLSGERLQTAGEKTGDAALRAMGARFRGTPADQMNDVPHFSRLLQLLFHPAGEAESVPTREDTWLPDLQLRLVRRGGWTLCCKGGHNGESHNHNDVGSFMLYWQDRPRIVDAGNMVYTAKTFSDQRYTLWNVRSAYHNLPLIGGCEQQPGRGFAARDTTWLPDGLSLDMAGAYGKEAGALHARRELRLSEEGLRLRDTIALSAPQAVQWVFMLRDRPERTEAGFTDGVISVACPPGTALAIREIPVDDPRMARSFPGSLWRLTAEAPANTAFDAVFTVTEKEK